MRDIRSLKQMIYKIYHILNRKQRTQMIGVFCVLLIGSLLELLGVSSMMPFVQSIMEPEKLISNRFIGFACRAFGIGDAHGVIILVGIGIIFVYLIKNLFLSFSAYIQSMYNSRIKRDVTVLMLRSYMQRPYSFFVETSTDVIMRGVQNDSACICAVIQNGFKLLAEMLVVIVIAIFLMSTDMLLTVGVLAVGTLCMIVVVFVLKKMIARMSSLMREAAGKQYKWISQITGGIKDIMVYNRQKYFIRSFEGAAGDACTSDSRFNFVSALPERIIEFFCVTGIIVAVILRTLMDVEAVSFVSKLAVFAMGAFRILPSISRSTGYLNQFIYYREWVDVAYENITEARTVTPEKKVYYWDEAPAEHDHKSFESDIAVDGVCWRYSESSPDVLNGVDIDINKGQSIGIIGESGSGKSTLSDILLGLYQPQRGEIRMDGVNINTIPYSWSGNIGYVPQSVFLIDDTIRENVIFGAEDQNDDNVWEALRKAALADFVRELPEGLDTLVGERGVRLSGGQRQRIAIARALYAKPQILILDEATAALDNDTERTVMEEISLLAGDMTLIIIAHRLSTLKNCDKIYEIINGIAVERDKIDVLKG